MRNPLISALLAGAAMLALGHAATAETTQPGQAPGNSNVTLSGSGPVQQPTKGALQLSEAQQQAVREAVLRQESHQANPGNFKPEVGGKLPAKINVHALPQPLVREMPQLKEYMYAHLDRSIVLTDSLENKIVMVLPLPDNLAQKSTGGAAKKEAAVHAVGGLSDLTPEQLRMIYHAAGGTPQPVPQGPPMMAGTAVPPGLTLSPLPPELNAQLPQAQGWQAAKLQDGRLLLVDAQRTVVGVITQDEGTRVADDSKSNTGVGNAANSPDPLHAREQSGRDSAYTGPESLGQNTDEKK